MSIVSQFGRTPRLIAAAAVSFTLFAGAAMAQQQGYVDVRVRDDNANCGPVVLKWPLDQEEHEYDPDPGRNDPKLKMAETRPLPVIHYHPALNAGDLYLPPQDGLYRHYFPESEAPPRLRRWDREDYEEYLREENPSTDVPFADAQFQPALAAIPGQVIVPTGMITPPVAFSAAPGGYLVAAAGPFVVPAQFGQLIGQPGPAPAAPFVQPVETVAPAPAAPVSAPAPAAPATDEEGTGSFIQLSEIAEKVPFVGPGSIASLPTDPAGAWMPAELVPAPMISAAPAMPAEPAPASPAPSYLYTSPAPAPDFGVDAAGSGAAAPVPMTTGDLAPFDGSLPTAVCGAPVCQ